MPTFNLTNGNDTFPTGGQDNSGDDSVFGLNGRDMISGGDGNDYLNGGAHADTLYGGAGDDVLDAGILPVQDIMDGGTGDDTAVIRYDNVINVGTQFSVRVVAVFGAATWSTEVDGFTGVTLSNFEHLQITSGNNDDSMVGGGGNDILWTLGGNDILRGGAGDDWISKTYGFYNLLDGGTGQDLLWVYNTDNSGSGAAGLVFDARPATGTISSGGVTTGTFTNFELYDVEGTTKADLIYLGAQGDTAQGGEGNDTVYGFGGDDVLRGEGGNDVLYGGIGDDDLEGGIGSDVLEGGLGNDTLVSGAHAAAQAADADTIRGGDGDDIIFIDLPGTGTGLITFAGAVYEGGKGNDNLEFAAAAAVLDLTGATITGIETLGFGSATGFGLIMTAAQLRSLTNISTGGAVQIVGQQAVTLKGYTFTGHDGPGFILDNGGQSFNVTAATQGASDLLGTINGGTGNDTITGSKLRDLIFGGGGRDLIVGNGAGTGGDTLFGGDGIDTVTGGASADLIDGGEGNDILDGGNGIDTIFGGGGNDSILGGAGNDRIFGGTGRDTMDGGAGRDVFVFESIADSGATVNAADVIDGFTVDPATGAAFQDRIDLSPIDAMAGTAGNNVFAFIGTGNFTAEGQVRVRQAGLDTIVEVNTTGATGAEMMIRLTGVTATTLEAADFIL